MTLPPISYTTLPPAEPVLPEHHIATTNSTAASPSLLIDLSPRRAPRRGRRPPRRATPPPHLWPCSGHLRLPRQPIH
ncbi:hypothetical protein ACP70R_009246 [Stipagrostis hirtigluma subsp. patula]